VGIAHHELPPLAEKAWLCPPYEDTDVAFNKRQIKIDIPSVYLRVLAAELLRKRKSEAIPSFVILLFSGGPGLYWYNYKTAGLLQARIH
jgi:hypothetical protein